MQMIGRMGMSMPGTACGWPRHERRGGVQGALRDVAELSREAIEALQRGRRHRCHHVRPNSARVQGLEREIGALEKQLQGYRQAGSQENISATLQLIARDRAMQQANMLGFDV